MVKMKNVSFSVQNLDDSIVLDNCQHKIYIETAILSFVGIPIEVR